MTRQSRLAALERAAPPLRSGYPPPIADWCPECHARVYVFHRFRGAEGEAGVGCCTLCKCSFITRDGQDFVVSIANSDPDGPVARALDKIYALDELPSPDAFHALLGALGVPSFDSDIWQDQVAAEYARLREIHARDGARLSPGWPAA